MQIEKVLEVSSDEFYMHLLQSAQYDIEQSTKQKITVENMKTGFTYRKKLNNKIGRADNVIVTLTKLEAPLFYEVEFKGAQGINKIAYKIEPIDSTTIKVRYEEEFTSDYKLKSMNYKAVKFFYKRNANKRINQLLNQIENYIIQNRKVTANAFGEEK